FIPDVNTVSTNILSGAISLTLGRGFTLEQGIQVRDQWPDGTMDAAPRAWIAIHPQFVNPGTAIVTDVRFRRALMYATDRQSLVDSLQGGLSTVADGFLAPSEPEYAEVQDSVLRYEYSPARATEIIDGMGLLKGPDGVYR